MPSKTEEAGKGRRANERRKQKIEALRLAAEAGDSEAIAQYEQHLSKLRERNQKYRQKVREAREADPEYLRQLDEKSVCVRKGCWKPSVSVWNEPPGKEAVTS